MNRPFSSKSWAAFLCALSYVTLSLAAAESKVTYEHDIDLKWGYVGSANLRGGGVTGSIEEQNSSFRYVLSPQVTRRALLRFGVEWERFSFSAPDSSPVPETLQQVSGLLGLDLQVSDKWLFRGEMHPGIYSDFNDIGWNHVDAPILLSAAYLANADLQWFFGLRIAPLSNYPVIPAVGVRWKFADEWTLRAILPEPRIEYEVSDQFTAYFGGTFHAGTFRMGDHFGDERGRPDLNEAVLDYFEVRVGPGFYWRIRPEIEIGANAGYMIYRRFDYADERLVFSSEPAPHVQIACLFRF